MTKINWGKILAAVTAGLGLVLQASQELGSISLPGKWNIIVAGAGLLAADILHIIEKLTAAPVVAPTSVSGNSAAKVSVFFLAFLLLASGAHAGYLISSPKLDKAYLSLPAGTALYLMPIEGFNVGASLPTPTYGLTFNEDLVLGDTSSVNGSTNLSPIVGIGASLYLDGAGVINGSGPLALLGGFNVIGPDLDLFGIGNGQGLVPEISFTKDFANGTTKVTGGLTVFTDLGPGTAKKL